MRDAAGAPVVIRNAPLLDDGTPMPTRYWLVDPRARDARRPHRVGAVACARPRPRSTATSSARAHERYASERDAALPRAPRRPATARRRRRHPARREVPARALRVAPRRRRRSGRAVGRRRARSEVRGCDPCRRRRHRHQLGPPARRRRRRRDAARRTIDRRTQITRLGQGVNETRRLDPDAIARTVAVIARVPGGDRRATASTRVRVAATSASRDATNRDDFFDPVEQLLGVRPELLSGEEEARARVLGRDRRARPSPSPTSSSTSAAGRPSSSSAPASPKG